MYWALVFLTQFYLIFKYLNLFNNAIVVKFLFSAVVLLNNNLTRISNIQTVKFKLNYSLNFKSFTN